MAGNTEAYMLQRNPLESSRLNSQHNFLLALTQGQLIHPSIPRHNLRAIADVGTGTGVWLQETAEELVNSRTQDGKVGPLRGDRVDDYDFVGFDISPSQFPHPHDRVVRGNVNVDFVLHDITEPFPSQYHGKFDLVHVRLLSYAIKAFDLAKVVENVVQILRPGGYVQWQESDATDAWATPATPTTKSIIAYVVSERLARGLTPAVVAPVLKTIQSLSITPTANHRDQQHLSPPCNWTADLMRVMTLETLRTTAHPSPIVQSEKGSVIAAAALQLLQAGVSRRQDKAADPSTTEAEAQKLMHESEEMQHLAEDIKASGEFQRSGWDMALTWIVAKKAAVSDDREPWMPANHQIGE